ncbi:MAG: hypothetical protein IPG91_05555 [Ideonella sp.]|nr:hypothetical protein [Ideonella sp.]
MPRQIVRPFEAAQFLDGDFVWDFLSSIDSGLPGACGPRARPQRVNESVPNMCCSAVDAVRASGIDPDAAKLAISQLLRARGGTGAAGAAKHPKRAWDGRLFELTPPLRKSILRMFADDYLYIAQNYLQEAPGGVLFKGLMT